MKGRRTRKLFVALCVFALLVGVTAPALASTNRSMASMMKRTDPVSPTFDLLVLRPVGLFGFAAVFTLFVLTAPIMLITRPREIGLPFERLVVGPANYVWNDPLGQH